MNDADEPAAAAAPPPTTRRGRRSGRERQGRGFVRWSAKKNEGQGEAVRQAQRALVAGWAPESASYT